jgi:hypothetical protein
MKLSIEDRMTIAELIQLHGHFTDAGELHRYPEIFTADVEYDVTDFGAGVLHGLVEGEQAARQFGNANPVGHHVTNVVVAVDEIDGSVRASSKGIAINADGSAASVIYEDRLRRTAAGWRIYARKVLARRTPLGGMFDAP